MNLPDLLARAARAQGFSAIIEGDHVLIAATLTVTPFLLETAPLKSGQVRTASATRAHHASFPVTGVVEFQHSVGSDETGSLDAGFATWLQQDLVTLLEAVQPQPGQLPRLEFDMGKHTREVVLGPPLRNADIAGAPAPETGNEEHDFCPCCLFTNSLEAFQPLLASSDFVGIRLFAARYGEDDYSADCRINGEDYPAALPLLIDYARKWPGTHFEFRKQYVVIRNKP